MMLKNHFPLLCQIVCGRMDYVSLWSSKWAHAWLWMHTCCWPFFSFASTIHAIYIHVCLLHLGLAANGSHHSNSHIEHPKGKPVKIGDCHIFGCSVIYKIHQMHKQDGLQFRHQLALPITCLRHNKHSCLSQMSFLSLMTVRNMNSLTWKLASQQKSNKSIKVSAQQTSCLNKEMSMFLLPECNMVKFDDNGFRNPSKNWKVQFMSWALTWLLPPRKVNTSSQPNTSTKKLKSEGMPNKWRCIWSYIMATCSMKCPMKVQTGALQYPLNSYIDFSLKPWRWAGPSSNSIWSLFWMTFEIK